MSCRVNTKGQLRLSGAVFEVQCNKSSLSDLTSFGNSHCSHSKYEGDFIDNNYNGIGTYYYQNGDVYNGEWKNGKRHGKGIFYNNDDFIDGYWENNIKIDNESKKEQNDLIDQNKKIN